MVEKLEVCIERVVDDCIVNGLPEHRVRVVFCSLSCEAEQRSALLTSSPRSIRLTPRRTRSARSSASGTRPRRSARRCCLRSPPSSPPHRQRRRRRPRLLLHLALSPARALRVHQVHHLVAICRRCAARLLRRPAAAGARPPALDHAALRSGAPAGAGHRGRRIWVRTVRRGCRPSRALACIAASLAALRDGSRTHFATRFPFRGSSLESGRARAYDAVRAMCNRCEALR